MDKALFVLAKEVIAAYDYARYHEDGPTKLWVTISKLREYLNSTGVDIQPTYDHLAKITFYDYPREAENWYGLWING